MKRLILLITPILLLLSVLPAFARTRHHFRPTPSPTPVPVTVPTPVTTTPPPSPIPAPQPTSLHLGAFNANLGTIQVTFLAWSDPAPSCSPKTEFIYWENTGISLDSIINGSQDAVITNFGNKLCPGTILSLFHEMNGNWDTWDGTVGNNSPAKVIQAYQHVHDLIGSKVQWAWVTNNVSVPDTANNQLENYYPGANYVDIVGTDAFTYSGETFSQAVPTSLLNRLKAFGKPVWITSLGTDINQTAWIQNMMAQLPSTGIQGLIYFDYQQFALPASTLNLL
jgi:Glycosyl hydrolase family 26